jgi:hypothetical protein
MYKYLRVILAEQEKAYIKSNTLFVGAMISTRVGCLQDVCPPKHGLTYSKICTNIFLIVSLPPLTLMLIHTLLLSLKIYMSYMCVIMLITVTTG